MPCSVALASAFPMFDFVSCPPLRMEDEYMYTLMMVYVAPMMHSRLKPFVLPLILSYLSPNCKSDLNCPVLSIGRLCRTLKCLKNAYLFSLCFPPSMFAVPERVKNLPCNAGGTGDTGVIPGSGRSPGGGNGNPLQYSCLKNLMDTGAWWATIQRVAKSQTKLNN